MSDREVDAEVAERVMGWRLAREALWETPEGTVACGINRWHPSTTGEGMLAVVEAMRGKGYDCKILLKDYAHVLFDDSESDDEWTLADGPHWAHENCLKPKGLPHTVCLAALKAVGG